MTKASNKRYVFLICALLVLATVAAYEPIRHNSFVDYDDEDYVTKNGHVTGGVTVESVVWAFTTPHASNWHPVTWISHMVDCELFGLNAPYHHLISLLFHTANTLLLFGVFKRMTGAVWCSGFVAAAFALHPLHVESVAWAAERKDVLSAFFWLLTMWAYVRYTERVGFVRYVTVVLLFALGLMAKPMVVTLPFVLLLLDYWPLDRFRDIKKLIIEKIPFFALATVSSVITFIVQKNYGAIAQVETVPTSMRISNALVSYTGYINKMIFPSGLAVFYPLSTGNFPKVQVAVSLAMLAALTGGAIYAIRRQRYLAVGWLWYLGTLVPVIGLIQVGSQAMADRYTYVPIIGLFIMISWGVGDVISRGRYIKSAVGIIAIVVLAAMLICTRNQVRYWENNTTLFGHSLAVTKDNYVMHYNLGRVLHLDGKLDEAISHYNLALQISPNHIKAYNNLGLALKSQGKFDEAINSFYKAIKVKPDYCDTYNNLGATLQSQGKLDEALSCFVRSLELNPDSAIVHNNLGDILRIQGRFEDAIGHFNRALEIDPKFAPVYNNLGLTFQSAGRFDEAISHFQQALETKPEFAEAHFNLGFALRSQGKYDEAIVHFRQALQQHFDDAAAHYNLGMSFKSQGKFDEAFSHFRQSLALDPNSTKAHYDLAMLLTATGKIDEAIEHFREAVRLNGSEWESLNGLAWLLATHLKKPEAGEAIALAERAAELTKYQNAFVLDTLAASYAAGGQFDKAVHSAESALELATSGQAVKLVKEINARLELYKQKKAYRESVQE